jgi:hypothetical protein
MMSSLHKEETVRRIAKRTGLAAAMAMAMALLSPGVAQAQTVPMWAGSYETEVICEQVRSVWESRGFLVEDSCSHYPSGAPGGDGPGWYFIWINDNQ